MSSEGRYTIWMPFSLPDQKTISLQASLKLHEFSGYTMSVKELHPYYAVEICEVDTYEEAELLLKKVQVGLLLASLHKSIGIKFSNEIQTIVYKEDPVKLGHTLQSQFGGEFAPTDALIYGDKPAIHCSEKKVRKIVGQPVKLTLSYSADLFIEVFKKGDAIQDPDQVLRDAKLILSIEIYSASHFQSTREARFLILCTALEAVAPNSSDDETVKEIIDGLQKQILDRANLIGASEQSLNKELLILRDRIGNLKQKSHTSRISDYIEILLRSKEEVNAEFAKNVASEFKQLYGRRGRIIHDGQMEPGDELEKLDALVRMVLVTAVQRAGTAIQPRAL